MDKPVYNQCKTTSKKIWKREVVERIFILQRCSKLGNRLNAVGESGSGQTRNESPGETGIRQKRNVTPESIGLVSIKAQADI